MGCSKSSSKWEVHSNTGLRQETRKISYKQPNLTPKIIRKRRTNKTQNQQKEGNKKVREEINKTEIEKTIEEISKTKSCFFKKDKQN